MFENVAIGFIAVLRRLVEVIPISWVLWLGRFFGVVAYHASGRRGTAYVNLKAAFGNRFTARERNKIVLRSFSYFGQNMAEFLRCRKVNADYVKRYVPFIHEDRYFESFEGKHGAIFLTAHLGNWELLQIVSGARNHPLHVLAKEQRHGRLNEYLNKVRNVNGAMMIQTGENVRDLIQALRGNQVVGVLGDLSGGRDGRIIRFFGRKTTAPDGIFKIARKEKSIIQMIFSRRVGGAHHEIYFDVPFLVPVTADKEHDVQQSMERYYRRLEEHVEREPDQWFWIYKRWKYCFTKRILFLHDGRAGHVNQLAGVEREFENLQKNTASQYEFPSETVKVEFKSEWHRKLFYIFGFLFYPWAQGRLHVLRFFLEDNCARKLAEIHADIIVSVGSSVLPVNMLLSKENDAKSVAMMTPPFPYSLFKFDLLITPEHDKGFARARHIARTLFAPNKVSAELLKHAGEMLSRKKSLPDAKRASIFIGGDTKAYQLLVPGVGEFLTKLHEWAKENKTELLVTTSRRTSPAVERIMKDSLGQNPLCRLLVIANEANIENVTYGMLALSDIAIVTEDSVSMISEAVSAGKKVIVLQLGNGKLPKKHVRFQTVLAEKGLIQLAGPHNFHSVMAKLEKISTAIPLAEQSNQIQTKLRELL